MDLQPPHTLLGVWAHPDDEAYLSAGLMARTVAAGGRVVTAFATRGELGTDDPVTWPTERFARHREGELRRALEAVGAEPPRFLGHRDGGCSVVDPHRGAQRIAALVDEIRPDVVVTFGRDGITGHPDHRAVSTWTVAGCRMAADRWGAPEVLLAALTPDFVERHRRFHDQIGIFEWDGPWITDPDDVVARIELTEGELDVKRAALAAHASQTSALASMMGESAYRRWWDVESFRRPLPSEHLHGISITSPRLLASIG